MARSAMFRSVSCILVASVALVASTSTTLARDGPSPTETHATLDRQLERARAFCEAGEHRLALAAYKAAFASAIEFDHRDAKGYALFGLGRTSALLKQTRKSAAYQSKAHQAFEAEANWKGDSEALIELASLDRKSVV